MAGCLPGVCPLDHSMTTLTHEQVVRQVKIHELIHGSLLLVPYITSTFHAYAEASIFVHTFPGFFIHESESFFKTVWTS